jgi:hypothetical protein
MSITPSVIFGSCWPQPGRNCAMRASERSSPSNQIRRLRTRSLTTLRWLRLLRIEIPSIPIAGAPARLSWARMYCISSVVTVSPSSSVHWRRRGAALACSGEIYAGNGRRRGETRREAFRRRGAGQQYHSSSVTPNLDGRSRAAPGDQLRRFRGWRNSCAAPTSSRDVPDFICWRKPMDLILLIVVLFLVFGGGGYWGYRRWR